MCGESASFFIPLFLMHLFQAKDLKQYGADATSFFSKLLSCAAIVQECSKAGTFETVLDWTTESDQDPCIKAHPRFQKTVDYSLPNDDSPSKQLGPVAQEDDDIANQPETATVEVQLTLLTPLAPAFALPYPRPQHPSTTCLCRVISKGNWPMMPQSPKSQPPSTRRKRQVLKK